MFTNWKKKHNSSLEDNARLEKENREQRWSINDLKGNAKHHTYTLGLLERQYEKHDLGKPTCEHCGEEYDWDNIEYVWLQWGLSPKILKAYNIGASGCEACSKYVGDGEQPVPKELYKEADGQEPNEIGWSCAMGWHGDGACCDPPEALVRCEGPSCREVTHASDMCPDLHHAYGNCTVGPHWCKYCCRSAYEEDYADTDLTCDCHEGLLVFCKCGLNPNDQQSSTQQVWESRYVKNNGQCYACLEGEEE
jgi:hypothetical protein